jgi:hypothetical protein
MPRTGQHIPREFSIAEGTTDMGAIVRKGIYLSVYLRQADELTIHFQWQEFPFL